MDASKNSLSARVRSDGCPGRLQRIVEGRRPKGELSSRCLDKRGRGQETLWKR